MIGGIYNYFIVVCQTNILISFGMYLVICLVFFGNVVRLLGYREQIGGMAVKERANRVLDFFIGFLFLSQIFFLNNVRNLFDLGSFIFKTSTIGDLAIIGNLDFYSTTLEIIVGFSFIVFLLVLRINGVKFDPFVILSFILLNPVLVFLCFSQNLIYFFIFFEGFAMITTVLIVISGQCYGVRVPQYNVLMYLIYSLVGTSLMTLGLTIIFILTSGSVSFVDGDFVYQFLLLSPVVSYRKSAVLVFFLVCLNIFFKLGVFPFQNWVLPIYNSLNTPVLFYVVLFSKFVVSLVFIFKFFPAFFNETILWIFFFVGIISMVFGIYFGLASTKLREIIGASSIVNYGIVVLLVSYSAPLCAIFYIFCYTITLLNVMICLLPYRNRMDDEIIESTDNINYRPRMTKEGIQFDYFIVFSIGALIGLPPFLFFYAKIYVLNIFINYGSYGSYVVAIFFLLVNVFGAVYYLRMLFAFIRGSTAALRAELITCYYSGSNLNQLITKVVLLLFLLVGIMVFYRVTQSSFWGPFTKKFLLSS